MEWVRASALLVAASVVGAFVYDKDESASSAIGYGLGVGLMSLALTLFGRFVYLRFSLRRDAPLWSQRTLAIAGLVGIVCVAVIAVGGTAEAGS